MFFNYSLKIVIFIFFILFSALSKTTITFSTEQQSYVIGDEINLKINLRYPKNQTISTIEPSGYRVQPFDLLSYTLNPPTILSDSVTQSIHLKLSIYATGRFFIPPITFTMTSPNGIKKNINTLPYPIDIIPLLSENDEAIQPKQIKNIIPTLLIPILSVYVVGAILILIILFYLIRLIIKSTKKSPSISTIILKELNVLKEKNHLKKNDYKNFFYHFSHIIKLYLEGSFHQKYTTMSTHEIKLTLEKNNIDDTKNYINILKYSDKVKFLKDYKPDLEKSHDLFKQFRSLVISKKKNRKK